MKKTPSLIHQPLGLRLLIIIILHSKWLLWGIDMSLKRLEILVVVVVVLLVVMEWPILEIRRVKVEQRVDQEEQVHRHPETEPNPF